MVDENELMQIMNAIGARNYLVAAKALEKILESEPENVGLLLDLGFCYTSAEKFEQAIETYKKVIEAFPNNEAGYVGLGFAYEFKGEDKEALAQFEKSLEFAPDNALVHFEKGEILLDEDEYDSAIECFKKAIQFGGTENDSKSLDRIARCNLGLEKYDEAIENANKILEIDPSMEMNVYNILGIAYFEKEEWENSITNFEKYLLLSPDDEDAQEVLEDAREELEESKKPAKKSSASPGKKSSGNKGKKRNN